MIFAAEGRHDSYDFRKPFSVEGIPDLDLEGAGRRLQRSVQ